MQRPRAGGLAALLLAAALLVNSSSRAQAPSTSTEGATARASAKQQVARVAARWLREAERRFQSGDPGAAIPLLERAYRETGWQGCLLNLGMAHHAQGNCARASSYYVQYLDTEPYSERRGQVEAALHELQQVCAVSLPEPPPLEPALYGGAILPAPPSLAEPAPQVSVTAEPARAPSVTSSSATPVTEPDAAGRNAAIGGFALGGAAAAAAVILLVSGARYERQAQRLDGAGRNPDNDRVARDLDRQGRLANDWALALGAGSLALLGGSAALWWLASSSASLGPTLSLSEGVPQLELRGTF